MKYLKTYESHSRSIKDFVKDKPLKVKDTKFKGFIFHGTNVHPSKFELDEDYYASEEEGNGNTFNCDIPDGVLFMTNDIREAKAYANYIIPCEVKVRDMKVYEIDTDNPSVEFDDDYMGYSCHGMYSSMMNEGYDMIEIRGRNKSTFVAFTNIIVPRTDLAIEFYGE